MTGSPLPDWTFRVHVDADAPNADALNRVAYGALVELMNIVGAHENMQKLARTDMLGWHMLRRACGREGA